MSWGTALLTHRAPLVTAIAHHSRPPLRIARDRFRALLVYAEAEHSALGVPHHPAMV